MGHNANSISHKLQCIYIINFTRYAHTTIIRLLGSFLKEEEEEEGMQYQSPPTLTLA